MNRIVVLGDLNLDVHAHAPSDLAPGEETRDLVRASAGGSAGTFARIAAARGASVAFLGCVGTDAVGDLLVRSLEDAGVESLVQRADRPSGVILALRQGSERTMVCSRGANDGIRADRIDASVFAGADHLHVSGYAFLAAAQRPSVVRAIELAHARGLSVSVDPPPANLIRDHGIDEFLDLIPVGAWLFPNWTEGEILTGASQPAAIVDRLAARFAVGALTLGAGGSLAWAGDGRHAQSVAPLESVDTTGAGDAFAAAFVVGYLGTPDVERANATACSAARAYLRVADQPVP
jgi:sugar/nucleoside kinase (ribokinase family)